MSTSALVELDCLTAGYGGSSALIDVDLSVAEGDFVGLVGPSGSGKTTVLRAILGSVAPSAGRLRRRPGLRVGYVPQVETVDWDFPVSVFDTAAMSFTQSRRPWVTAQQRARVESVLERLGMEGLGRRHIRELSGGQQQRVFLARALVASPDLLLLDEPTSGVDVRTRHEVLHLLADLNRQGISMLLTTHDLNGIAAHLPRIVCLNRVVVGEGPPAAVITPELLQRTYGAPMDVLVHGGMPVAVDRRSHAEPHHAGPHDVDAHRPDSR